MFKIDIIISSVMLRINISKKGTFHGTLFLIIEYDKAIYDNNLLPFPRLRMRNGYTVISRRALETIDLDDIYPYYGYCNDLLAKLNVFNFNVIDVAIPAAMAHKSQKSSTADVS